MDDKLLVESLISTCTRQLALYRQLNDISQKILGQVVLSRGDVSGIAPALAGKQRVLAAITEERTGSQAAVTLWQERKGSIPQGERTAFLNQVLADMGAVIKQFIEKEDQLKKYLEHALGSAGA
jgi:hypothetical protein